MVKSRHSGASIRLFVTLLSLSLFGTSFVVCLAPVFGAAPVEKVSTGQRAAALEFLSAVASGDPQAVALTIHPDDLQALRLRLLATLRDEASRGDGTIRTRLFGQGMALNDIERLTNAGFYATLASRLHLTGREYASVDGLAAIPDKGDRVQVVLRGHQPKQHGRVEVVNVVTLRPYGKDWKAAIPDEIEAQVEDLIEGRTTSTARPVGGARAQPAGGTEPASPAIVELLTAAEKSLNDGRCDDYYGKQMSPNFRKVTGKKALETLVSSCKNSMGTRQLLLSTLNIVRGLQPRYENDNQRAVYDLSGQGLPFQTFTLEQVDRHWFIAE
jgi:hypothetical protein